MCEREIEIVETKGTKTKSSATAKLGYQSVFAGERREDDRGGGGVGPMLETKGMGVLLRKSIVGGAGWVSSRSLEVAISLRVPGVPGSSKASTSSVSSSNSSSMIWLLRATGRPADAPGLLAPA